MKEMMAYSSIDHYGPIIEKKLDEGKIVRVEADVKGRLSVFDNDGNRYSVKPEHPRFKDLQKLAESK